MLFFKNHVNILIFTLLFLSIHTFAQEKNTLTFAPLPMQKQSQTIRDFIPLTTYFKDHLNLDIKFVYKKNYKDIIDGFISGEIDMAYLGPLPLISLKNQYKQIEPIVNFLQDDGKKYYKCTLVKFKNDKIDLNDIKVALTQPLSTCGYYMTKKLIERKFHLDIEELKYDYKMTHPGAILSILSEGFTFAGVKDSIAKKHSTLGIEIIEESQNLPGFALVVNKKTISEKQVTLIKNTILTIPKEEYLKWGGVFSNGFTKANISDYEMLDLDFNSIPTKGNM